MKRKLLALLVTLAIIIGSYGVVATVVSHLNAGSPIAQQGRLDLSHWNFRSKGAVRLIGDWDFYPNQLITPRRLETHQLKARRLQYRFLVPGCIECMVL